MRYNRSMNVAPSTPLPKDEDGHPPVRALPPITFHFKFHPESLHDDYVNYLQFVNDRAGEGDNIKAVKVTITG